MDPTLPHPPARRSFAQWLIRTEPVALVLLLVLAVLLFALVMTGVGRRATSAPSATTVTDSP